VDALTRPQRLAATVLTVAVMLSGVPFASPAHADWVRNDQWQLGALNAVAAWRQSNGDGVTVAVVDSGVDARHPDLVGQVLPGIDLVDGDGDGRRDPVGHGTTVASLIAGDNDKNGVVGIAPNAKILPVRVLDRQNRYEDAAVVARGIQWAVDHGADVINLSLGGMAYSEALAQAVTYAANNDVVIVACTGNVTQTVGDREIWYPARQAGVVAVTGLRDPVPNAGWFDRNSVVSEDPLWSGSLTGSSTVLSAPAVNLLGARPEGYWRVQGTSFAAPLVAGAAALVRAKYRGMNAANVINRLIRTANDLGAPGRDDRYGYGEVNPLAALTADVSAVDGNPLIDRERPDKPTAAPGKGELQGNSAANAPAPGGGGPVGSHEDAIGTSAQDHTRTGAFTSSTTSSILAVVLLLLLVIALFAIRGRHGRWYQMLAQRYARRGKHAL
jgi:type VII secretion-associated serine protease mycosin